MLNLTNGLSTSVWMKTASVPEFLPLSDDIEASVCVIGAGIAGLTTAYLLSKEGKEAVVIDAMGIGAGETGRTTAHFFPPDEWYVNVEDSFGTEKTRLVADSFSTEIDLVESILQEEGIACEFERLDGYLYALSAKCTHLGCIVHWNSAERSWDCSCHGSRFDIKGEVLHGPAPTALEARALDPEETIPITSQRRNSSDTNLKSRRE